MNRNHKEELRLALPALRALPEGTRFGCDPDGDWFAATTGRCRPDRHAKNLSKEFLSKRTCLLDTLTDRSFILTLNTISSTSIPTNIHMPDERYNHVESRKREGAHYTPTILADFISDNILRNYELDNVVNIVDPAVGDGELLLSLINAIRVKSNCDIIAYGFDTNAEALGITRDRFEGVFEGVELHLLNQDFLTVCCEKNEEIDPLFMPNAATIPDFDLLIANPPYIRTQVLGAAESQRLSQTFGLKGRVDIYQAFMVAMASILAPNAVAGVVVSNRFLTTKGAADFRAILHNQYAIKGLWDFGDTKLFEAAVLPAVLILTPSLQDQNANVPFSSVYMSNAEEVIDLRQPVCNQIEALEHHGSVESQEHTYQVRHGYLKFDERPSDVWRLEDSGSLDWLNIVDRHTWCLFKDVGKIRVGVKTTADKVFIRSDWLKEVGYEPELLLPLTTHHIAGRFRSSGEPSKKILYTHRILNGVRRPHVLKDYPLSREYLEDNKLRLSSRKYLIDANREWYEIWVPQDPDAWQREKVVFRDICEHPTFWMDEDGSVVNGDCYWMMRDAAGMPEDILWLILAVANSRFIEKFYDIKFQNKLYSNRRRFISQYVELFPIPDPSTANSENLINLAQQCYREDDSTRRSILEQQVDELVFAAFGLEDA